MERDPHISKLMKEGGVQKAPAGFTARVMDSLPQEAQKQGYSPLIGKKGMALIFFVVVLVIALAVFAALGETVPPSESAPLLDRIPITMPDWQLKFEFMGSFNPSVGVAAALAALFLLVLSDARINRRHRFS